MYTHKTGIYTLSFSPYVMIDQCKDTISRFYFEGRYSLPNMDFPNCANLMIHNRLRIRCHYRTILLHSSDRQIYGYTSKCVRQLWACYRLVGWGDEHKTPIIFCWNVWVRLEECIKPGFYRVVFPIVN